MVALQHGYAFRDTNRRNPGQKNARSKSVSFICKILVSKCSLTVCCVELKLTKLGYTRLRFSLPCKESSVPKLQHTSESGLQRYEGGNVHIILSIRHLSLSISARSLISMQVPKKKRPEKCSRRRRALRLSAHTIFPNALLCFNASKCFKKKKNSSTLPQC
jgi:hypothetical protein